jgi:hypothetical protein
MKVVDNRVVYSDIDVTIFNGDTVCTAAKYLYRHIIQLQDKLNSLKSHNSCVMIKVGFIGNYISELLDVMCDLFLYEIIQKGLLEKRF